MLEYKNYIATVEFDDSVMALHGRVVNVRDTITFEAKDAKSVEKEFRKSVDTYLEFCKKEGVEPEKPFSGEFRLRLGTELHRKVSLRAASKGQSLNAFIKDQLEGVVSEG
jgi:predicted HicB family RNase H-like nuclease